MCCHVSSTLGGSHKKLELDKGYCKMEYVDLKKHLCRDYLAGLATQYDEIIDVRTPLEFEEVSTYRLKFGLGNVFQTVSCL